MLFERGGAKFSEIEPTDDGWGFVLHDADDNPLASFVYETERQARQAAKFIEVATEEALGVVLPGPF